MLMGDLIRRNTKLYPEKTAIIYEGMNFSYSKLDERIKKLTNGLLAKGIKKGDRVGILEHPSPQYIELYIAVPKIGAVLVPLNCRLAGPELNYIINDAEVKMLILGSEFINLINSIKFDLKTVKNYFCLGKPPQGMSDYEELITNSSSELSFIELEDDEVAVQMYTSGTTGKPKGVMMTHKNLMSMYISRIIDFKLSKDDIFLSSIPFFHTGAEYALIILYIGGTLVIHREFNPGHFLETIGIEKVTFTGGVPSMLNFLLQHMEKNPKKYDLSSMKTLAYGASPMPVAILEKIIKIFKCDLIQSYGLTEASPGVSLLRPDDHIQDGSEKKIKRLASCGKEIFNVETKIVNEYGIDVKPGEVGEIIVKSDGVMKGYWKLPEATAKTIRNGWLYTGDMATVDDEDYIFIVDRKKDMIISGGENIYPREVEETLYANSSILDAAVIGVPDEEWGESVKAFVVLKDGEKLTEKEIIDYCKENMASYKKPKSVEFINALPRNPTGKVLKKELRKKFWEGYNRGVS